MAEYIEREAVLAGIEKRVKNPVIIRWLGGIISEQPAADVVPVVRCKDCNYLEDIEGQYPYCSCHNHECAYNNFCSYGERKDGEE